MLTQPIRVIFGKTIKPALKKQESCGSLTSKATASTEDISCNSSLHTFQESCSESSSSSFSESCCGSKTVSFDVDEYDDVVENVFEYPAIPEQDKSELFWTKDEIAARRQSREALLETDCIDRSRFIACVEELFQVPLRKRQSVNLDENDQAITMGEAAAINGLVHTEYRGYEYACCRVIVTLRRQVVRKILAAHWVRAGKDIDQVSMKLSQRQVNFARLAAQADAKFAAEYLAL